MPLLVRIDVDRPYGRTPLYRHVISRVSSDLCIPPFRCFGFLRELRTILEMVNAAGLRTHVFFRACTLPSPEVLELLDAGQHEIGLHLENSRTFSTFRADLDRLTHWLGRSVTSFSKHGSGNGKFGLHHYPPYEPHKYINWALKAQLKLFLGNLEDPTVLPFRIDNALTVFPAAFWLEPSWRDTTRFPVEWLLEHSRHRDIVLLIHPENVLACATLTRTFKRILSTVTTTVVR